jgi:hypothetical protein
VFMVVDALRRCLLLFQTTRLKLKGR